ncbi:MAG: aldolase [Leptospirales bacterium]|nr:aldolase [Leptospirales bacterium]
MKNRVFFEDLKLELDQLTEHGLVALKTGTEVEDMSFEEIRILRALCREIVPLYVKIGGAEARNDMRALADLDVDGIIAPMIESVYALEKFIESMKDVLSPAAYRRIEKGINLETVTAFNRMSDILSSEGAQELVQVTAARTDLSGSLRVPADHEIIFDLCSHIVARSKEYGLRTSVGGAIKSATIERIVSEIEPDTVNTRHMVMDANLLASKPVEILEKHLMFEVHLYQYLAMFSGPRQASHQKRAEVLLDRMTPDLAPRIAAAM